MNTNYLTLNHPETYKDFFNKYDLVISTPFAFPLVWDTSIHSEGNTWMISQKLPLRQYMGINFSHNDKDIEFVYYENDEFKKWKLEHFFSLSKDFFDEIWINYQIGFLSEYHYHNISTIISNISFFPVSTTAIISFLNIKFCSLIEAIKKLLFFVSLWK